MPAFLVSLWLDGYETEQEMIDACSVFILEQLDFTASSVKVRLLTPEEQEKIVIALNLKRDPQQ